MPSSENADCFDIGIIGGGIAGAGIARDAALRGLKVVLFEKNTFGSGTSSKSSKLIHGGIRYLELAWAALLKGKLYDFWENFRFVFLSLRETSILGNTAPDLVKPLQLVIPVYQSQGRSPLAVYFGAYLYSFLALLTGSHQWPKILGNPEAVLKRIPNLKKENLKGGVVIWDHVTDDLRLVQRIVQAAQKSGAQAFEHAAVTHYQWLEAKQCYELDVAQNSKTEKFHCKKLINASGPWIDQVRRASGDTAPPYIAPIAGSHIHLKKFVPESVILQAQDSRVFFVINLGEISRVGTTERAEKNPDALTATEEEVDYLLKSLQNYFPGETFTKNQILSRDAGIRPLARPENNASPNAISREHKICTGKAGVLHIAGVKLTDHRRAAEEIVDRLAPGRKSLTAKTPL